MKQKLLVWMFGRSSSAIRATLHWQRSPAHYAVGRRPPAWRGTPRPAEGGAASESRRGEGLITLGGQSGTAIASGRELLARGERDDSS